MSLGVIENNSLNKHLLIYYHKRTRRWAYSLEQGAGEYSDGQDMLPYRTKGRALRGRRVELRQKLGLVVHPVRNRTALRGRAHPGRRAGSRPDRRNRGIRPRGGPAGRGISPCWPAKRKAAPPKRNWRPKSGFTPRPGKP